MQWKAYNNRNTLITDFCMFKLPILHILLLYTLSIYERLKKTKICGCIDDNHINIFHLRKHSTFILAIISISISECYLIRLHGA